jgi:hypothetical protein
MPRKISQLEAATDVTASDLIQIVDIEDTGMAVSGTNKKCTAQLMANELGKLTNITATGSTTARSLANRFADVVNVKDFGAVGDGVTDDTAAIQAALNTSSGKTLIFQSGVYRVTGPLNGLSNTHILGYGATLDISTVPDSAMTTERCVLDFCGSYGSTIPLTADALTTNNIVNVANSSLFQEGDLVQVWMNSPGRFLDPGVAVKSGQLNIVTGVYTNKLVLDTLIFDELTVANGASIRKITPVENVYVEGLKFKGRGRRTAEYNDDRAVSIRYGKNANIINCVFDDVDLFAVRIESCYFGSITGCEAKTQKLGEINKISYAFIYSSSQYITVSENKAINYRHSIVSSHLSTTAFEPLGGLTYRGVSRFITVRNNHITGNYGEFSTDGWVRAHAGIATHTDVQFLTISNNNVTGCRYGLNLRSLNCSASGNILSGNLFGVYLSEEYDCVKIDSNIISECLNAISTATDSKEFPVTQLSITNNNISNCETGVFVQSDTGSTNTGLLISGNSFTDIVSIYANHPACISVNSPYKGMVLGNHMNNCDIHGIVLNQIQNIYISNNLIIDMKSESSVLTRYAVIVRVDSPNTIIQNNHISNVDVAFGNPTFAQILTNTII